MIVFSHMPSGLPGRRGLVQFVWRVFRVARDDDFGADGIRPDASRDELENSGVGVFGGEQRFRVFLLVNHAYCFDGDPAHGAEGFIGDVCQGVKRVFVHQALEGAMSLEVAVQRLRWAVMATFTATRPQMISEVALVDRVQVGKRVEIEGCHCSVREVAEAVGFHAMPLAVSIRKNDSRTVASRLVN